MPQTVFSEPTSDQVVENFLRNARAIPIRG
jgi:hypothetical protein